MTPGQIASTVICALFLGLAVWVVYVIRTDTDDHAEQLADPEQQLDNLQWLLATHLGLDMDEPATDEIPVQPGLPTEPMAVAAATPAVQARRDTAWDADAAQLRPVPQPRTTSPADDPDWRRRFGLDTATTAPRYDSGASTLDCDGGD